MCPPYQIVRLPSGASRMTFVFRFSRRNPPRTPPKGRKIFWLGFASKSHGRCNSSPGIRIWSQNFKFPSRSGVISVFRPLYYVNFHFFAFRAVFRAPILVFCTIFVFPDSWAVVWAYSRFSIFIFTGKVQPTVFSSFAFSRASRAFFAFSVAF